MTRRSKWAVDEEWWRLHNLRASFNRFFVCPLLGHDTLTKMDGTKLCHRH